MPKPTKPAATALPREIDAETDARLRQAASLLIDEFLRIDSMKDNDNI